MAFKRKELPKTERVTVVHRDKLMCVQCKKDVHLNEKNTSQITLKNGAFHHIIPLVYKGDNKAHNACILCVTCHNKVHSGSEDMAKYFAMYEMFVRTGRLL